MLKTVQKQSGKANGSSFFARQSRSAIFVSSLCPHRDTKEFSVSAFRKSQSYEFFKGPASLLRHLHFCLSVSLPETRILEPRSRLDLYNASGFGSVGRTLAPSTSHCQHQASRSAGIEEEKDRSISLFPLDPRKQLDRGAIMASWKQNRSQGQR